MLKYIVTSVKECNVFSFTIGIKNCNIWHQLKNIVKSSYKTVSYIGIINEEKILMKREMKN